MTLALRGFINRMRALEVFGRLIVDRGGWFVVRLDGCGVHCSTQGRFDKPFDERFRDLMAATATALLERFHAHYTCTMSDETFIALVD